MELAGQKSIFTATLTRLPHPNSYMRSPRHHPNAKSTPNVWHEVFYSTRGFEFVEQPSVFLRPTASMEWRVLGGFYDSTQAVPRTKIIVAAEYQARSQVFSRRLSTKR
jgi:hypothetical protein